MPIINLCKATDEGAVGHHNQAGYSLRNGSEYVTAPGPTAYWTRLSHVGLCIRDYEYNGYHDSDFYMTVWNPEKNEPENICFASTRGWSYPCYGSSPDATPDVMDKYRLYQLGMSMIRDAYERKLKAADLRDIRKALKKAAVALGFDYLDLIKVYKKWSKAEQEKVFKLLTGKIRSGFKVSLRNQVVKWINDPEKKYAFPLSKRQMEYL